MPEKPLADVLCDVGSALRALSELCDGYDRPHFPSEGVGVLCRMLGDTLEHAAGPLLDAAL